MAKSGNTLHTHTASCKSAVWLELMVLLEQGGATVRHSERVGGLYSGMVQQLVARREALGMTQAELARRLEVGNVKLHRWETQRNRATVEDLIAGLINCDAAQRCNEH